MHPIIRPDPKFTYIMNFVPTRHDRVDSPLQRFFTLLFLNPGMKFLILRFIHLALLIIPQSVLGTRLLPDS